jgi:transposase-like protein
MSTASPSAAAPPIPTKPRTRVNWTPAERAEWLSIFEKSGHSVTEFCRANDLPSATLSLWRQQQAATGPIAEGGELVEIASTTLMAASAAKPLVTIRVPGDVAIEVSAPTDPKWLGALVKQLSAGRT